MKTVQIYDKPMCCSTGICGPQVDPVLPRFASDLDWIKAQGNVVERYSLSQNPEEFAKNEEVKKLLGSEGVECLPLVMIDGKVVSRATYPSRDELAQWTGAQTSVQSNVLPVAKKPGGCCGSTGCC
ncbi:MAG: arsenite efflux transporter metallochaperone ArsD [Pirellulaceae bacterium]|nr:arsenite efflux transporter metallochaperone ArsD [Pirellulaceae bacterium]